MEITISVSEDTHERMKNCKPKCMTFNEFIKALLDESGVESDRQLAITMVDSSNSEPIRYGDRESLQEMKNQPK